MKESNYKSYDELPLFLNAVTVAKVLGIAPSSSYELMHEKDFPTLRIGNRIVVANDDVAAVDGGLSGIDATVADRMKMRTRLNLPMKMHVKSS